MMTYPRDALLPLALVASACLVACAPCPPPPPQQAAHHHHPPPPGARGDHGPKHGAHHERPKKGRAGKGHHRKPPKEAFEACAELEAGAECMVKTPHGNATGTCFAPPDAKELACRPNERRGGKHGPGGPGNSPGPESPG